MKKVVLVLGAGSSKDFDVSMGTGADLIEDTSNRVTDRTAAARGELPYLSDRLDRFQKIGKAVREEFVHHIDQYKQNKHSIDYFINDVDTKSEFAEHRAEFKKIATFSIAFHILGYEGGCLRNAAFERKSWLDEMDVFFRKYHINSHKSRRVDFKIVTFNYDRIVEEFLYRKHGESIREFVDTSLIHVYGKIAPLGWQHNEMKKPGDFFMFGHPNDDDMRILGFKDNIILMHDERKTNPHKEVARNILMNADVVLFMGYGFDDYNNRLLQVQSLPRDRVIPNCYTEESFEKLKQGGLLDKTAQFSKESCIDFIRKYLLEGNWIL